MNSIGTHSFTIDCTKYYSIAIPLAQQEFREFMIVCPNCKSTTVFLLRIDSDWCSGLGDYYPINDRTEYTEKEWNMDASDRPDIEVYHCRTCGHIW